MSSLWPRELQELHIYVHIPTGVRDGRDATLPFQLQFLILLIMGQTQHTQGYK